MLERCKVRVEELMKKIYKEYGPLVPHLTNADLDPLTFSKDEAYLQSVFGGITMVSSAMERLYQSSYEMGLAIRSLRQCLGSPTSLLFRKTFILESLFRKMTVILDREVIT